MLNRALFGDGLSGIYRSYRKGVECVYAESAKLTLQLADQPISLRLWQSRLRFWGDKIS